MTKSKPELLDSILEEIELLPIGAETARDAVMNRATMLLRNICGEDSHYLADLKSIHFYPMYAPSSPKERVATWHEAAGRLRNLINTVKEEIELFNSTRDANRLETPANRSNSSSVFVVHGHDEEFKQSVARTIERLGLVSVILHEKPNKGRTIIEKFDDYSQVGFAVVLLSADDVARAKDDAEESYRARQNVIFELGFFLGRLGRERVAAIFRPHEKFELPSDYGGVAFIEYDPDGAWRYKLAKELKASGHDINVDAIL